MEYYNIKVKVKVAQSCLTLCNRMDYTVHGILQARMPELVAIPFSRVSFQFRGRTQVHLLLGILLKEELSLCLHLFIYSRMHFYEHELMYFYSVL